MKSASLTQIIVESIPELMDTIRYEMRKNATDDLTIPQFRILNRLSKSPELLSDLAKWLGVSKPTTSVMVNNLIKRKLVTRIVDSDDKRQFTLCCSPTGLSLIKKARTNVQLKITNKLDTLTSENRKTIMIAMQLLKDCLL